MILVNGTAAICARIQSDRPAGHKNAGWLHKLKHNPQTTLFKHSPIILEKVDEYPRANINRYDLVFNRNVAIVKLNWEDYDV
jgi:hypothetical protein